MKNILKIYKRDLKNIFTNWVALVIVLAVIILPSLYAWFNIKSCWDPYSNTGGIKVAVVNEDLGGEFNDKYYNAGKELIETLEDNDSFGWQFVSKEEADRGVIEGDYYASIEVPEDFTSDILSLTKSFITRPSLIYNINEKSNAIVPKITNTGVNTVKDEINSKIVKIVNGVIFDVFNKVGTGAEDSRGILRNILDTFYSLNDRMPELEEVLNDASNGLVTIDRVIEKVNEIMPIASSTISESQMVIENGQTKVDEVKQEVETKSVSIKGKITDAQQAINSIQDSLKENGGTVLREQLVFIKGNIEVADNYLNEALNELNILKNKLDKIHINTSKLDVIINEIQKLKDTSSAILNELNEVIKTIDEGNLDELAIAQVIKPIEEKIATLQSYVTNILNRYDNEIAPYLKEVYDSINDIASNGLEILDIAENTLPDINYLINLASKNSALANDELQKLREKFPSIKEKINTLTEKVKEYDDEENFNKIIELLVNDSSESSNFLSNIVNIEKNSIFAVPNYGSGMSPFYTTLALWVGGTILVSLLTTHARKFEDGEEIKPVEEYFGKGLTFISIAIIQGLVVTLGDIFLLGTYVVHPVLFVLIGILISIVFVGFIYTLVSVFGNVGKALAIIFLVLQVAASGGTFPVEVMSDFFQKLNPLLPFKYAIGLMRETTAGIVYNIIISNLLYLLIYLVIAIVIGVGLKKFVNKHTKKLSKKLDESGIAGH